MNRLLSVARRREIAGENCGGEESGETNIPVKAPGPRGTDRPYHKNIHTIFLDTHITSCQDFADARGDKSIFWDYFCTQRPLTLRCSTAALYGAEPPSSNTLEQRNYRVSGASALISSVGTPETRFSRPKHQITSCSGIHSKKESRLFDLFHLLQTQRA